MNNSNQFNSFKAAQLISAFINLWKLQPQIHNKL